jgi:adenine-specific DNA-methyltransferase
MNESTEYLSEQIITYLGNKRSLLSFIGLVVEIIKRDLKKDKLQIFDVFSGSGVVARFFKQHASNLYVNDLEDYSYVINSCYLTNKEELVQSELLKWYKFLTSKLSKGLIDSGFIYEMYSPKDDNDIKLGERTFYTSRNAKYIDSVMHYLDVVPEPYKTLLLGPLLYEASTKSNTSGVFKGFYKNSETNKGQFGGNGKNALNRILADIQIKLPVLSNHSSKNFIFKGDSNEIVKNVPHVDLAYLDPPYNQHPYGSNYFMLNLICNNRKPQEVSDVSGIPSSWNQSNYNKKKNALSSLKSLCKAIKSTYLLISYNSEGFISYQEMKSMLQEFGKVRVFKKKYNVFRASRNLKDRKIHLNEYLFLLKKG